MLANRAPMFWRFAPVRPFMIGAETDSTGFLELFAVVLEDIGTQFPHRQFEIQPGPILVWSNRDPPKIADLEREAAATKPPKNWPGGLRARWSALRGGPFLHAAGLVGRHAATFEIEGGEQACRLLAAIAQTSLTARSDLRQRNLALARCHHGAGRHRIARRESDRVRPRSQRGSLLKQYDVRHDEAGASVCTGDLTAWYGSHVGPHYAQKSENQDASVASGCGGHLIFAIADGMSTSTGARLAAAAVARSFCAAVAEYIAAGHRPGKEGLMTAARVAQNKMDELLTEILDRWTEEDFSALHERLPRNSALIILRNTATPTRPQLPPALAATLLGGVVSASAPANEVAHLIVVGDGVVEHIGADSYAATVFDLERSESALDAFVGPGPIGKAAVERMRCASVALAPGDCLLASSDGLSRGHTMPIWQKLGELDAWPHARSNMQANFARTVLERAAAAADTMQTDGSKPGLFNDNLSLVLISRAREP